MSSIEQHLNIQELSKQVPDWREILEDLIQKEMEQLEKNGHARPNDFVGMDRYDSDEELRARNDDFNRYSKLKDFRIKLDATRKSPTKKSLMERLSGKKRNKESLFDEER